MLRQWDQDAELPSFFDRDDTPEEQARKLRLANLVWAVMYLPARYFIERQAGVRTWT